MVYKYRFPFGRQIHLSKNKRHRFLTSVSSSCLLEAVPFESGVVPHRKYNAAHGWSYRDIFTGVGRGMQVEN